MLVYLLSKSIIFFHYFSGPTIKSVPVKEIIFPNVKQRANFFGLPSITPIIEPNDINSTTVPITIQDKNPINLSV